MGILNKLFGQTPNPMEAERVLIEGREKLWMRQINEAECLLNRAIDARPQSAIPFAYRSLLNRMQLKLSAALKDADHAVALAPNCFEAHAARAAALLTDKSRLVDAMAAYGEAGKHSPHDAEGHHLNMVIYLLFAEMLLNSVDGPDEVILNFKLTPITRCATRLIDGYPELALGELKETQESSLWFIGMGLAFYRLDDYSSAASAFKTVVDSFPAGTGGHYVLSIKRLLLEAEKNSSAHT